MALIKRLLPLALRCQTLYPISAQTQNIHRWVAPTLMELKRIEDKQGGKKTFPRNTYLEWNLEAELFAFGKRLNEEFDSDILLQAFIDRSYVIKEEMKQKEMNVDIKMEDNITLSQEGEKFIEQYIRLYLKTVLPKFPGIGVAAITNHLLSQETLSHIALNLGMKDIILSAEYPVDKYVLATAFKAVVGALLQSSGDERTAHFVRDFVITQLQGQDLNEYLQIEDPWATLTDILKSDGATVEPRLIGEVGKNTLLACYRVGLYIDKKMISSGFGESVATAKEMAAREALKKVFGTEDHMKPVNFQLEGIPKPDDSSRHQIANS